MFAAVAGRTKLNAGHLAISIVPGQCSNLKSALKAIIRDATNQESIDNGDEEMVETRQVRMDSFSPHPEYTDIIRTSVYWTMIYKFSMSIYRSIPLLEWSSTSRTASL